MVGSPRNRHLGIAGEGIGAPVLGVSVAKRTKIGETDQSVEEVLPALRGATETFLRHVPITPLHFQSLLMCDDASIVFVFVVERELGAGGDRYQGEQGELVDVRVGMVVGDGEETTVRVAAVVHEPGRATDIHAVAHVEKGDVVGIEPHVLAGLLMDCPVALVDLLCVPAHFVRELLQELGLGNSFGLCELVKTHEVVLLISRT